MFDPNKCIILVDVNIGGYRIYNCGTPIINNPHFTTWDAAQDHIDNLIKKG